MWLPPELAMLVGSYLNPRDLQMCTTQLCSSGTELVALLATQDVTTIRLHALIACCRLSAGVEDLAQLCVERIESFVKRRGNAKTIILHARLKYELATNASVYSDIHSRLQQGSSLQLSQNQGITVEWHVSAASIAQVEFLLKVDVPNDGARVSHAQAGGAIRQCLHTLYLQVTEVSDLSPLASCQSLHTLDLNETEVSDVSALASCQSLHTLNLGYTGASDVSALAALKSLHTLDLENSQVSDVSALAACQSLHTLNLVHSQVSDVSALAACKSLHTLRLEHTQVSDVSALAACKSLHTLDLEHTQVSDVSALAACKSLHTLDLVNTQVSDVSALASCQSLHTLRLRHNRVMDGPRLSALAYQSCYYNTIKVSDVSALASCQSLRTLVGVEAMIGGGDVMRIIQDRG
jgi:hypothetical protein